MSKRLPPVVSVIAGVVFAGAAGYYLYKHDQFSFPGSDTIKEMVESGTGTSEDSATQPQELAKVDPQAADDAGEAATAEADSGSAIPGFDVLRVEKDGSTVIAGTAPANSEIEVVNAADGNKVIGSATSLPSGDYAIVLEEPLAPGKHELYIVSKMPDGSTVQSADAGLIEVPAAGSNDEPTVLVMTPDAPTRVLQAPDTEIAALDQPEADQPDAQAEVSAPAATDQTDQGGEAETAETATETNETAEEEQSVASDPATEETTSGDTQQAEEALAPADQQTEIARLTEEAESNASTTIETVETEATSDVRPVLIQAADVEEGKIYIAGQGEPGGKINMYFGEKLIGSTTVAENGAFLFEGDLVVEPGTHAIRADMVNDDNTSVLARAEVRLVHQPEVDIAQVEAQEQEAASATEQTEAASAGQSQGSTSGNTEQAAASDASTGDESATAESATSESQTEVASEQPVTTEQEVASNAAGQQEEATAPALSSDEFNNRVADQATETESEVASASESGTATEQDDVQEIRTGTSVIIRRGDNLWRIARRNYGEGIRYTTIFQANRDQIRDPDLIYPGQVFDIPENADSTNASNSG